MSSVSNRGQHEFLVSPRFPCRRGAVLHRLQLLGRVLKKGDDLAHVRPGAFFQRLGLSSDIDKPGNSFAWLQSELFLDQGVVGVPFGQPVTDKTEHGRRDQNILANRAYG